MALASGEARKDLSADALFGSLRSRFASLPDLRSGEVEIPLADALMSAFAMFSLKDPSLLAFDHRRHNPKDNFRTIYGINRVPCDSQMRDILDPIDPANLRAPFREVFRRLQRGQVLKRFVYLDGHYLLSLDGTTYFSSSKIHCSSCLEKHHRNGSVSYSHQLLGATLVHPDLKEVIPLAPEPIIQQDGQTKNDCERNATRRWLKRFRQEHPHLPVIVVEDGLSANAPHLRDLREARSLSEYSPVLPHCPWISLGLGLFGHGPRARRALSPPQLVAALQERRQIFRRLWVKQISCHSADTFSSPRNKNWRIPRADLI